MKLAKTGVLFCILFAQAVSAVSQEAVQLDTALRNGVRYFEGRLPRGTKLAVLHLGSESPNLAKYVLEEIVGHFVNSNSLILVDRDNLAILEREIDFQLSGEVSNETVLSLGRRLGAQTVLTGSIELRDNVFRLRIRAIDIETAVIQGQFPANVARDRYLVNLYNSGISQPPAGSDRPANGTPDSSRGTPSQRESPASPGGSGRRLPDYLLQ